MEGILAGLFVVEFGGGHVESQEDFLAELITGGLDGGGDGLEGGFIRSNLGRETAFVADGGRETLSLQHFLESVEDFRAHAERFAKRLSSLWDDHEFLDVDGGIRVGTTVHDVHQRNRQHLGVWTADVSIKRLAQRISRSACDGHRDAQDGIRAELALVLGAIEFDHGLVDGELVLRVYAREHGSNFFIHIGDGLQDALAIVTLLRVDTLREGLGAHVAIAKFMGLISAGRGTRRHGGAAEGATSETDVDFDGRVAAGIENLAGGDIGDIGAAHDGK